MANTPSAPLPDLDLEEKSILIVDTGDAAAIITRMVIHFTQAVPDLPEIVPVVSPLFVYGPNE